MTAYTAWHNASTARQDFFFEHSNNWTDEVAVTYRALADEADRLFLVWRVESTDCTLEEVEAAINERIHSARD